MLDWVDIPGFEGWYECHPAGFVRSVTRTVDIIPCDKRPYSCTYKGKILKGSPGDYPHVTLWTQNVSHQRSIAHLVMLTFVGPRPDGMEVCHNDGDPTNSDLDNLRYDTPVNNNADKRIHGTHIQGEAIPWSFLTNEAVAFIRAARGKIKQHILAAKYGTSQGHISRVQTGKQWAHIS